MNSVSPLKNPLIIALDVDSEVEAHRLAEELSDLAGGLKVGPRLVLRSQSDLVMRLSKIAPVFFDFKFFDIPSTMESAVRAAFESGASLVTVHALAGGVALKLMAKLEMELNQLRPFRILVVTILTSFEETTLPRNLKPQSISQHVSDLVSLARDSGLRGIVCSPHELSLFEEVDDLYLVTPGIRGDFSPSDDQKRTMGPTQAIESGATALVVGRPIIAAQNPREAALKFSMAIFA